MLQRLQTMMMKLRNISFKLLQISFRNDVRIVEFFPKVFCAPTQSFAARWFIAIFVPWFFAETCEPAFFPVFADYFSHTAASTIFAKYRMITRRGNMSIFMYDYYFLFYLIAGWIIMLKNGKRESLNSFKSCKIFRFSTKEWSLAHIRWLKLILMSHLSLRCFILPLLVEFQQPSPGSFSAAVLSPLAAVASQKICNFNYSVYFHKKLRDFN